MEASKSRKYRVWLSFETTSKVALEGLFLFLDKYEATECGNKQTATLLYPWANSESLEDLAAELKREIAEFVPDMQLLNLYLVYPKASVTVDGSNETYFKLSGKVLSGRRTRAPWDGFYKANLLTNEDE